MSIRLDILRLNLRCHIDVCFGRVSSVSSHAPILPPNIRRTHGATSAYAQVSAMPGTWEEVSYRQISPCVHAGSVPHTWLSILSADPTQVKSEHTRETESLSRAPLAIFVICGP